LLTGDTRGHYGDYANAGAQLLRTLLEGFAYQGELSFHRGAPRGSRSAELPPEAYVNFLQNHDQIGNRPDAARMWQVLDHRRQLAAETLLALLPTPILMFMGDEFHAPSGFPFFCDFTGELAAAVTEGRRTEFASLWSDVDCDSVPKPTTEAARLAAVLDWSALEREPHRGALERARQQLAVRRRELHSRLPARAAAGKLLGQATLLVHWTLKDGANLRLAANLAATPYLASPPSAGRRLLATTDADGGEWPPWHVEWTLES
jgi:maltooligosyltrehalose trehalohydrolase